MDGETPELLVLSGGQDAIRTTGRGPGGTASTQVREPAASRGDGG